jgi:hypothetical protein
MGLDINGNSLTRLTVGAQGQAINHIIQDGLVLYLDAADKNSYPGSGTVWYDLSGNGYNGTFYGGTTFNSSESLGVIQLNGSGSYVNVPGISLSSSNFTVIAAARYTSGSGRIISGLYNNWLLGHWSNSVANYYSAGWVSSVGPGGSDTSWRIYAGTGVIGGAYTMYINGNYNVSNTNGTAGPNGLCIGGYGPGGPSEFSYGQVGFVLAYNRVLTAAEINQSYGALMKRYTSTSGGYYNCAYGCQYYTYNPGCTAC